MQIHFLIMTIYTLACAMGIFLLYKNKAFCVKKPLFILGVIVVIGFAIRMFYAFGSYYFTFDIGCFKAWSSYTTYYGLDKMYFQDYFLDYPPGYMYILFITNCIGNLFNIPLDSSVYIMLLKLPAMLADIAGGLFIYYLAKKHLDEKSALLFSAMYIFCPAIIFNSSIWGQIDSFYTLFLALSLYMIYQNKTVLAAIIYAYAVITKPQALLFGPIFLFYIMEKKSVKELLKAILTGLAAIYIMVLPFCPSPFDIKWLVELYLQTFGGYKYFTVNAYNIFMVFGLNWHELGGIQGASLINFVAIPLIVGCVGFAYFKIKDRAKIFFLSYITITLIFNWTIMMHERYLHPAMLLCLIAAILCKEKIVLLCFFLGTAVANYINIASVMRVYFNGLTPPASLYGFVAVVLITLAIVGVLYVLYKMSEDGFSFRLPLKSNICIAVLTIVYAVFAFFKLGSTEAPQSFYQTSKPSEFFTVSFEEKVNIKKIYSYSGMGDQFYADNVTVLNNHFEIVYSPDGYATQSLGMLPDKGVFEWGVIETDITTDSVTIKSQEKNQILNEIIFVDENNQIIPCRITDSSITDARYSPQNTIDERHMLPKELTYYYSTYFDEIYHARTAYEQLNDYHIYESTHPPLGKTIIGIGISIFGMTPFGWRFMGTLCGVLMVPIIYLLASQLLKNKLAICVATFIFTFDFMHITQTRLATVDTYVVLFTMLTFLFMIKYSKLKLSDSLSKQFSLLALSGFFMGCAMSTKWNSAYAIIGLAVFFFAALYKKYMQEKQLLGINTMAVKTILFCFIAFVLLPLGVYILSFADAIHQTDIRLFLQEWWNYQKHMYSYHSTLEAEHYFASLWYTWPFTVKPIWYFISRLSGDMISTISAFGNPLVWWPIPFAVTATGILAYKKKCMNGLLIVAGYLAAFIPWVFITRLTFIYHYFPAVIFGVLAIGYVIDQIINRYPFSKKYVYIYLASVLLLFVMFYPVLTGVPTHKSYVENFLHWFNSWYFY